MSADLAELYNIGAADNDAISSDALAGLNTNRQGRAVLGVAAHYLQLGYKKIETMPSGPFYTGVKTQDQAKDLLNRTRLFAEKTYRNLPNNNEPISTTDRKRVSVAYKQAVSNLQLVSSVTKTMSQSLISDALSAIRATAVQATKNFKQNIKDIVTGGGGWLGKLAMVGAIGGAAYMVWKLWPRKSGASGEIRVLDSNQNNPPNWVHPADIGKWERSVDAVKPDWSHHGNPYAVVTHIYKNMGGRMIATPRNRETESVARRYEKLKNSPSFKSLRAHNTQAE